MTDHKNRVKRKARYLKNTAKESKRKNREERLKTIMYEKMRGTGNTS